jgi:hypothetical protein
MRTYPRYPTSLIVMLLFTGNVGHAASGVERYIKLNHGSPTGFEEVRHNRDSTISVHYEYQNKGRGPKEDSRYRLAADGTLLELDIQGWNYHKVPVSEHFSLRNGLARWQNDAGTAQRSVSTPVFYESLNGPPEEIALLVRALLKAPGNRMNLLPAGEASLRRLDNQLVRGQVGSRGVTLYAITGLELLPQYVWLDEHGRFFADTDRSSPLVLEGWADTLPQLVKSLGAQVQALNRERAASLTQQLHGPLAIEHVRVFDPDQLAAKARQTVLVNGGRIVAAGNDGTVAIPEGAQRIDGHGRFLMPGLWDMHVHLDNDQGILDISTGITTVRDLGNTADHLAVLVGDFESGADIGPRVIKAGLIDGRGPYQATSGVAIDTAEEAVQEVDHYADSGYVQIKIYSSVRPELVPVIVKEARARGLRVSGHVPAFMTAQQFVEDGVDEIQHINFLFLNFFFDQVQDTRTPGRLTTVAQHGAELDLSSPRVRSFVELLKQHQIVVDPTLADFESKFLARPGLMAPTWAPLVDRSPARSQLWIRGGGGGLPVPPGMDARYRESFERMVQFVGLLYRSGVTVVAGTDGNDFATLPRELELYVNAGIPPAEVLRLDTLGAAQVMKRDSEYGRIAPGYVSDLIVVEGDPLLNISDIRKVRTVLRGDRLYDTTALLKSVGITPVP